jgi:hypothetical protein
VGTHEREEQSRRCRDECEVGEQTLKVVILDTSSPLSGVQEPGEPPKSGTTPVLDERLCALAVDSLTCVQAVLASSLTGLPCGTLRKAMHFTNAEKIELAEALQKIAVKHATFCAEHKDTIELGMALTAMQAAQFDHVLLLTADKEPLSGRQVLASLAIIFAPLLALLVVAWLKRLQAGE